jgi:antitoxin component of MazEF toxin-antitoxin module
MSKRYTLTVEVDSSGEYYITLPDSVVDEMGLTEESRLQYDLDGETIILSLVTEDL